jgi:P-type Ca2+ transporter type 2C
MKKPPRRSEDALISHWHLLRYLIIGLYVGVATVGVLISWYISEHFTEDNHTKISYYQLSHWTQCHTW